MVEKGNIYTTNDISENFNLLQFMDTVGNVNNKVIIDVFWTYNSNNKKTLILVKESLDIIYYSSGGDEIYANSEVVYFLVRYFIPKGKFKWSRYGNNCCDVQKYIYIYTYIHIYIYMYMKRLHYNEIKKNKNK